MRWDIIAFFGIASALILGTVLAVLVSKVFFESRGESKLLNPDGSATAYPTLSPTNLPSFDPTDSPSTHPTAFPTSWPSMSPTESTQPTSSPSWSPSSQPSMQPTMSAMPTSHPSFSPTISSEPSAQPSASPTTSSEPSSTPSERPTSVPSGQPSANPTISTSPTSQPSQQPTISSAPSSEPSLNPTISTSPTTQPSQQPTLSTSPSTTPSLAPSISTMPTGSPSSEPTSIPSAYPSSSPSLFPTSIPTLSPSDEPSLVPSQFPSQTTPRTIRIIIGSNSSGKSMVAVGAVFLVLIASTAAYVSRNAKRLKGGDRHDNDDVPSLQDSKSMCESSDDVEQHGNDTTNVSQERRIYSTNSQAEHDNTDMVEIDLEDGRASVQPEDSVAESSIDLNSLSSDVKQKGISAISKIFHRRHTGTEKQVMSWMDIRDDGSPACSSGCEPAKRENSISSLSPKFSPLQSIPLVRMKMQSLISVSSEETDDLPSIDGSLGDSAFSPTNSTENEETKVPNKLCNNAINANRQGSLDPLSVYNRIQAKPLQNECDDVCVNSNSSIFSGVGDLSPAARRQSVGQNMGQLKNILGAIKTLGSYEESFISTSSAGTSVTEFKSKAKARLGLNGNQGASRHSQEGLPTSRDDNKSRSCISYEKELLGATDSGGLNFGQVLSAQRHEVYECRVPSGPLGIIVESTKVGVRVKKINTTSSLCNKISVGDIIIAVDEVDVVGVDASVFWQLVSRRANKQERCLVALGR